MRIPPTAQGKPGAGRPSIRISIAPFGCQKTVLQAGGPWGRSDHVSSFTERWVKVKRVLSKWRGFPWRLNADEPFGIEKQEAIAGDSQIALTWCNTAISRTTRTTEDKLTENVPPPISPGYSFPLLFPN
jgi:hypothetical protein